MDKQTEIFFNTANLKGDELTKHRLKAGTQNERIYNLLEAHKMSPSEVHKLYCALYKPIPITSIRRALTTLTSEGYLEKTGEKKKGYYDILENIWKKK